VDSQRWQMHWLSMFFHRAMPNAAEQSLHHAATPAARLLAVPLLCFSLRLHAMGRLAAVVLGGEGERCRDRS
jgi:hypothetical protein